MSIYSSSRKSNLTSKTSSSRRSVRFRLNYNLKSVLTDFENEKEHQSYKELVCNIRDAGLAIRDDDLLQILTEARSCINLLGKAHHLFVQVLLLVKWAHRSVEVAEEYHSFVVELCSAHNYFTKLAVDQLVSNFKSVEFERGEDEDVCHQRVHAVLKVLLQVIPMSVDLLVSSLAENFPYVRCKDSSEHAAYTGNVLRVLDYRPELRLQFLTLIISKLLSLDVNAPRSELLEHEEETEVFSLEEAALSTMKNPVADSLDLVMDLMFKFIHSQCHNNKAFCWQRTKAFYSDMITVFDKVIIPTHASHHVQFLLFYLLSFKSNLVELFLKHLWRKVVDPNVFHVIRQASIGYIASLMSRAKYVPMSAVKETLTQLSQWIHTYIANCDSQPNDPRMHSVFYSACQAMFYMIAFRHKDIVLHSPRGLAFLQGLNLGKVVTCRLNPLRVCLPAVTHNFASVSRHYQLAYCYSVIEHNQRSAIPVVYRDVTGAELPSTQVYLDTFFPFDPYLLKRTNVYISELYREYDSSLPDDHAHTKNERKKSESREEEDDFLMETSSPVNSSMFTYGTSPGFMQT